MSNDTSSDRGFQFPGRFEISAMGAQDADLERRVIELLQAAGLRVDAAPLRVRPSRQGTYVSVTAVFHADSRADYEAAHAALRACPDVKWTL